MATITLFNPLTDEIFPVNTAGFDVRYVNTAGDTMTGDLAIQPAVNSATALRVNQADGTNVLTVDTANSWVGINGTPETSFHVFGGPAPQFILQASAAGTVSFRFKSVGNRTWDFILGATGLSFSDVEGGVTPLFLQEGGRVGVLETTPLAQFHIQTSGAAVKGLIVKGYASQSANLQEWQDSASAILAKVTPTGGASFADKVGIGVAVPATSAWLELSSTTGALLLTRMTTVQRDALTAVNGMVLYNTNNNRLEAYENGAWVDL